MHRMTKWLNLSDARHYSWQVYVLVIPHVFQSRWEIWVHYQCLVHLLTHAIPGKLVP
jgi:hypothetical protein